jgi:hypothetical protein
MTEFKNGKLREWLEEGILEWNNELMKMENRISEEMVGELGDERIQ